jgi:UDPglucose 6-dehydrogenase
MTEQRPVLSVIGLGKLGAPMAACFAAKGFDVVGADVNEAYVHALENGRPPVFEPNLAEMIAVGRNRLHATTATAEAVRGTDVTFVVVATPTGDDGGFSLRYVLPACEQIGRAIAAKDTYHLVVITSTVMPGSTGAEIRAALEAASGKRCGGDFGLCYSPEFIALGSVVRDFLNPDFLLIGESDERAGEMLASIYRETCDTEPPIARMNWVNAELAKISVNTFVTTKIAFANMLARMCERLPDADVDVVTSALGLDTRIGARYLKGAISYGGPCFPRDNVALATLARSLGAPAFVAEATDRLNREGISRLADLVRDRLGDDGVAAVLGLSYKPNTDVVEESPGLLLARELSESGVQVVAYDPAANQNAQRTLGDTDVRFAESVVDALEDAGVVVVATAWPEFTQIDATLLDRAAAGCVVIDCWRMLDPDALGDSAEYVPLGAYQERSAGVRSSR